MTRTTQPCEVHNSESQDRETLPSPSHHPAPGYQQVCGRCLSVGTSRMQVWEYLESAVVLS